MHNRNITRAGLALLAISTAGAAAGAAPASAAPNDGAGCVAVLTHGELGSPGSSQRDLHVRRFGQGVAQIAHQDPGACENPYSGRP